MFGYSSICWSCRNNICSDLDKSCPKCGWYICNKCNACGCEYNARKLKKDEPKTEYNPDKKNHYKCDKCDHHYSTDLLVKDGTKCFICSVGVLKACPGAGDGRS